MAFLLFLVCFFLKCRQCIRDASSFTSVQRRSPTTRRFVCLFTFIIKKKFNAVAGRPDQTRVLADLSQMDHVGLVPDESERDVGLETLLGASDVVERLSVRNGVDQEQCVSPLRNITRWQVVQALGTETERLKI